MVNPLMGVLHSKPPPPPDEADKQPRNSRIKYSQADRLHLSIGRLLGRKPGQQIVKVDAQRLPSSRVSETVDLEDDLGEMWILYWLKHRLAGIERRPHGFHYDIASENDRNPQSVILSRSIDIGFRESIVLNLKDGGDGVECSLCTNSKKFMWEKGWAKNSVHYHLSPMME